MYIDRIWPFTTFISRNKHKKNIRLRLYWLRLRVAEAEVQTSHQQDGMTFDWSATAHSKSMSIDSLLAQSRKVLPFLINSRPIEQQIGIDLGSPTNC